MADTYTIFARTNDTRAYTRALPSPAMVPR